MKVLKEIGKGNQSDNESPIPQKSRRESVIKLNPQYVSGIRGKQRVRGEPEQQQVREEPEQQQQEVRGEPEKQQVRAEPEKHPHQHEVRDDSDEVGVRGGYEDVEDAHDDDEQQHREIDITDED